MTDAKEAIEKTLADRLVLKGTLFRRQGRRVELTKTPPTPHEPRAPVRRPAKVARMLALAHHLQRLIDQGLVADRAALARKLGLTRARVTQLLDLLLLAPRIQEMVLTLDALDGVEPISEGMLRRIAHAGTWREQDGHFRAWASSEGRDTTRCGEITSEVGCPLISRAKVKSQSFPG